MTRVAAVTALCGALAVATVAARQTRADGDSMEQKLTAITARGNRAPGSLVPPLATAFTERELNAYLRFNGASRLPIGLREPSLSLPAADRFDGRAVVDLDQIRKSRDYGMLVSLFLQGTHEIKVSGTFIGTGGKGVLKIASASLDGVPMAQALVDALVSSLSKTPDAPAGFQLDKPFDLPAQIQSLRVRPGAITVIQ